MADYKRFAGSTSMDMVLSNYDLLMEILIRLPAKPLLGLKSVSKQWQSVVSATSFRLQHTLHHSSHLPKPPTSFILEEDSKYFLCHLTLKQLIPFIGLKEVEILQSCNGLLLLRFGESSKGRKDYYVCNPTTVQLRKLALKKRTSRLCLVFDPSKSPNYRVVCFRSKSSSHWVETYDSETHTWKKGAEFPHRPKTFHNVVYWNREVYYIRPRSVSQRFILNDKFHVVPGPPLIYCLGSTKNYVMESNGHMHCVALPPRPDKNSLVVLEMDEKNLTWFVKYSAVFPDFSTSFYQVGPAMDVLGVVRGEKEEDSMLLFSLPGKIMVYKFFDNTFEEVVAVTGENRRRFVGSFQFFETLVPV